MKALSPLTAATELYAIEERLADLSARKEELKKALFDNLKKQGVKSVKLNNGAMYLRSARHTLKPVKGREAEAYAWASDHHSLKIDTAKGFQILRRELSLPPFFKVEKAEYLVVRRPGQVSDE
jgi:hypothetical protein